MNFRLISSLVASAALLAACAETTNVTPASSADGTEAVSQFLTQDQLLATIPGSTIHGTSSSDGKTQWVQKYSKGGTSGAISGLWGGDSYTSTWYVKDDMWCEKSDTFDGCWSIQKTGSKELQAYKNGTEKLKNPWLIK